MADAKPAGATSKKPEVKKPEVKETETKGTEDTPVAPVTNGRKLSNGTVRTDN